MISLVPSESWGFFKVGLGFRPEFGCRALPARCIWQGSGFAADQTNAMLAVVRADDESLVPPQAAGLALSVARPLPTETASLGFGGSPVGGGDKNSRFAFFLHFCVWVVSLPSGCCGYVGTTWRGVYFSRKTAFSEWVLCADGRAVPSCTQCFFGTSVWGWYHYPRRALHAVETLDARGSRWLIAVFMPPSTRPVWAESPHGGYTRHPIPQTRTQRLTRRNTAGSQGRW